MKKLLLLVIATVSFTAVSFAQEQGEIRLNAGLAFGSEAQYDGSGFGLNVGGEYFFTDIISASPSYTYFFKSSVGDFSARLSSINIDGRYYFLTDDVQVYGLAGLAILSATVKVSGNKASDSNTGLNIGGGIVYPLQDNLALNGQIKYQTPGSGQLVINAGVAITLNY